VAEVVGEPLIIQQSDNIWVQTRLVVDVPPWRQHPTAWAARTCMDLCGQAAAVFETASAYGVALHRPLGQHLRLETNGVD